VNDESRYLDNPISKAENSNEPDRVFD
jgi:hypothetical protein